MEITPTSVDVQQTGIPIHHVLTQVCAINKETLTIKTEQMVSLLSNEYKTNLS